MFSERCLGPEYAWARKWLFEAAFPLWLEKGWDRQTGGFHDALSMNGARAAVPNRLRVQTRQIYAFSLAGKLGWGGDWLEAVLKGLHFLRLFKRDDGLYMSSLTKSSCEFDLYDQAFVLLALASAYEQLGFDRKLASAAMGIVRNLRREYANHHGGFEESIPPSLPLRSNPHMHLFEAALAWVAVGVDECFRALAIDILLLAESRFVVGGSIAENFDQDWRVSAETDAPREPGHQFEWAFLLSEADRLVGSFTTGLQQRLYSFGTRGINPSRNVVHFSMDSEGGVVNARARLWAQTERLRASLRFKRNASRSSDVRTAFACVRSFLTVPTPGLWYEWQAADGSFEVSDVPATTLYHIVNGFSEFFDQRAVGEAGGVGLQAPSPQ